MFDLSKPIIYLVGNEVRNAYLAKEDLYICYNLVAPIKTYKIFPKGLAYKTNIRLITGY